jgi:D-alanyl-D-alanine carboxypeptidase/D-alanyl-D-alanine-endopeptidase (penicillin-binding protein 4)
MPRRSSSPIVVVAAWSVTTTMALLVLWQWSVVRAVREPQAAPIAGAPTAAAPATPLLSMRRAPGVLAWQLNGETFAEVLRPVVEAVGPGSCFAASIDGRRVAGVNETQPVIPASNQKVIVAAAALEVLGPDYVFTTTVTGELGPDGVVAGDLALIGGGDPVLSTDDWLSSGSQRYPAINTTRLEDLADRVVAAGVTSVQGRIVGDASRYDDEWFIPSWDTDLHGLEAGPYDALLVDDADQRAGADPAQAAADTFTDLLEARGVEVAYAPVSGVAVPAPVVASVSSRPLTEVLQELLLTSDDNTAELLVKELGVVRGGSGATAAGLAVVSSQLASWGLALDGVVLVDGSGLSRSNLVTCGLLLGVLERGAASDPVGAGMAVAGTSGTLGDFFLGGPVDGRLQGKTGTLSDVKSLAGYLPAPDGSTIAFALIQNEPGVDDGAFQPLWEQLLAPALASYPSGPGVAELGPR